MRVLLVEDVAAEVEAYLRALEPREVVAVRTLSAAMAALRDVTRFEEFDVSILDLGLPDSSGLATVARLHAEDPALPIVVATGLDGITLAESLEAGAFDLIKKPFRLDVLCHSIEVAAAHGATMRHLLESATAFRVEATRATQPPRWGVGGGLGAVASTG